MQRHRRTWVALAGLCLLAAILVSTLAAYSFRAQTAAAAPANRPDDEVVNQYFEILNAGMKSGDFSALDEVYAPDATVWKSNPNSGTTHVYSGIDAIIAWYGVFQKAHPGLQFAEEDDVLQPRRNLAPHVVLSYEDAPPPPAGSGDCMHVFTLKGGMIQTLDWVTFNAGT